MEMKPTIVAADARYCIATANGTLIQLWRTETPADGVARAIEAIRRSTQPIHSTLIVVQDECALPDPPARKLLEQLTELLKPTCKIAAMVHEGTGFRAAAVRAILTSLAFLTKQAWPYKIFQSVQHGTTWMADQAPDLSGIRQLGRTVTQLRAQLDAEAPKKTAHL